MRACKLLPLIAFTFASGGAGQALATAITKSLTVDVFQVCNDSGTSCASTGPSGDAYFSAEVNKIWSQAGISVNFVFVQQIDSTFYYNINDNSGNSFTNLTKAYGTYQSATTVDMFLVNTIVDAYGEGWLGAGGLAIAMDTVMAYNHGDGRIDTIAHELGHNLGLVPNTYNGSDGTGHTTNPVQLMASGGIRDVPATMADIAPDGRNWDQIPADQISIARGSSLLRDIDVPEPESWLLLLAGIGCIAAMRRRTAPRRTLVA